MGRYHPQSHDSYIKCDHKRCGALNAPRGTQEYDTSCWRCGGSLDETGKPEPGDELEVDIVDTTDDGRAIAKTDSGFVLFLDREVAAFQADVRVVDIDGNSGEAKLIESQ